MGMLMRISGTGPPVPPRGTECRSSDLVAAPVPAEPLAGPRHRILSGSGSEESGEMANGLPENLISKSQPYSLWWVLERPWGDVDGMNHEAGPQIAPEGRGVARLSLCLPLPTAPCRKRNPISKLLNLAASH